MATPAPAYSLARPTPLWAVFVFTFINSVGTGLVTNGIFYLTQSGYGFSRTANLLLALALGATYILGAGAAGPVVRWLQRRSSRLSSRAVLACLMALMFLLCLLPAASAHLGVTGAAPVWIMVSLYSPLTGVLWPMTESFLSGGRSGRSLRSAVGAWNIVWSGAIIVAYWGMAAFVTDHPAEVIVGLGLLHLVCAAVLAAFAPEPAPHVAEHHEPHPPVYTRLLVVFRMLLPLSYVVSSALGPILPEMMRTMGVGQAWRPVLGSMWLVPRTISFAVLQRWQGWHGSWVMPVAGAALMLGGFGATVLSPLVGDGTGVGVMVIGLALFGTGMATIYSAALYYAMEVGQAEVDAGGTHEALIGVGYTIGPLCGLAATGAIASGVLADRWFQVAVLSIVGVLAGIVAAYAARRALREVAAS
jgi:hypothetical protein